MLFFDFADQDINHFLGLDEQREAVLAVVQVPALPDFAIQETDPRVEDLDSSFKQASRVSEQEVDYPLILDIHQAGREVREGPGDGFTMARHIGPVPKEWTPLSYPASWPEKTNLAQTILTRRSRRNFVTTPLPRDWLSALLESLGHPELMNQGGKQPSAPRIAGHRLPGWFRRRELNPGITSWIPFNNNGEWSPAGCLPILWPGSAWTRPG